MTKLILTSLFMMTLSGSAHAHLLDCNLADGGISRVIINQMPDQSLQLGEIYSDGASSVKALPLAQWTSRKIHLSTGSLGTAYLEIDKKTGKWIYYFISGPNSTQGNADCR